MESLQHNDIFKAFDELSMIMDNLKKKGNLSLLERDLMLEDLRKIYSISSTGIEIIEEAVINESSGKTEQKTDEIKIESPEIIKNDIEEPVIKETSTETEQKTDEIKVEPPEIIKNDVKEPVSQILKDADVPEIKETKSVIGEKYQGSKEYMNEHISKQRSQGDISVKLHSKPIEDIGKAIGLNEKFLYINELFKGDAVLYKKTIEILNNCKDFNDAFSYIENNFKWDMNKIEVQNFLDIVKRKYISPSK